MKNTKILIKALLALIGLMMMSILHAAGFIPTYNMDHPMPPTSIGISSPNVSDFIKYGNLGLNYYNGLLNLEIPLGGYKDRNFDIQFSIKYLSAGFQPYKRPGFVGNNWILNNIGVVSRQVQGMPDDFRGYYKNISPPGVPSYTEFAKHGFLSAIRFNVDFNSSRSVISTSNGDTFKDYKLDLEPDIFNFSMCGHSGAFIINRLGKAVLLSGDSLYKIDITNLATMNEDYYGSANNAPSNSSIKITAPDGYIYVFGGNSSFFEYVIPQNPVSCPKKEQHITSWYLKKIIAPNNRVVDCIYTSPINFKYKYYYIPYYSHEEKFVMEYPNGTDNPDYRPDNMPNNQAPPIANAQINITDNIYMPILREVLVDGKSVAILNITSTGPAFYNDNAMSYKLESIKYYYNQELRDLVNFEYITQGSYFFLASLTKHNKDKYAFEYNLNYVLPDPMTVSTDHWGFWSGGNATNIDAAAFCTNINANRSVKTAYADATLLNRITYPTGGYTEIKYEPNSYTYSHKISSTQMSYDKIESSNNIACSGVRVKSLIDYTKDISIANSRNFSYSSTLNGAKSSGVIGLEPIYIYEYILNEFHSSGSFYNGSTGNTTQYNIRRLTADKSVSTNNIGASCIYNEFHIGYSDVIEKFSNGSYVHYKYSSYKTHPNNYSATYTIQPIDHTILYPDRLKYDVAMKHQLHKTNDLSRFRGNLLCKTTYTPNDKPLESTIYTYYSADVLNANKRFTSIASNRFGHTTYFIYMSPLLIQKEETVYTYKINNLTNNITSTIDNNYNKQNQLLTKQINNSDNITHVLRHKYVTDFNYNSMDVSMRKLADKNIIVNPVLSVNSADGKHISACKYSYQLINNRPLVQNVFQLQNTSSADINSSEFHDLLCVRNSYHVYDVYDNPVHITDDKGLNIVYIWGYKGQYLVAELKNTTYDDLIAVTGSLNELINSFVLTETDINMLNSLRSVLPNAMVTTYTHKPLVGVTSITDPSGRKTTYEYDDLNRLSSVRNDRNEIIESYTYNYNTNN